MRPWGVGSRLVRIDKADVLRSTQTRVLVPEKKAVAAPARRPCGYVPGMKVV